MTAPPDALSSIVRNATAGEGTTPASSTLLPAEHSPATRAASSIGPETLVSRPTTRSPPLGAITRAAARPRASARSGVRSLLATPRTPSVPNSRAIPPSSQHRGGRDSTLDQAHQLCLEGGDALFVRPAEVTRVAAQFL